MRERMTATNTVRGVGLSLVNAYTPRTDKEASDLFAEHECVCCGKVGQYIAGDKGKQRQLGRLHYYRVGMRCICGFVNFVYLVLNDIDRERDPEIWSSADALADARNMNRLTDPRLEEALIATQVHAFQGQLPEAIEIARSCVEQFPDSAPATYNLGYLFYVAKEYDKALKYMRRATELDATFSSAWFQMGIVCQERADYTRAIEYYDRFLEIHPTHDGARRRWYECKAKIEEGASS